MYINKQALDLIGITYDDYLNWCAENNKAPYKKKTRNDFFTAIKEGRIVIDKSTGKLINKRIKKDDESNEDENEGN